MRGRVLEYLRDDPAELRRRLERRRSSRSGNTTAERAEPVDRLAELRQAAVERFDLELRDMRATMLAMAACCEQSLERVRDAKWVSYDAVSHLVTELGAETASERARAAKLGDELEAARRELESARGELEASRREVEELRADREKAIEAARDAAIAELNAQLTAAREQAEAAVAAEARVREELTAVRTRNQEIVDAQMLRLLEFKRELEIASVQTGRVRAPQEQDEPMTAAPTAHVAASRPPLRSEPARNDETPEFAAIEAVLAGSPPVAAWPAGGTA
jgi:hypothetical protein